MKPIVIIYHHNCPDGFSGAWAAYKKFGNKADYIGGKHRETPPFIKGKIVYFIDFSYPPEIIKDFIKNNKQVTIIDHHVTAKESAEMTQDYLFDLDHSGAVLAWQYFHPGKPVPQFLKHVEDVDLWRFKLANSKEIMTYIDTFDFTFPIWNKLVREIEDKDSRKDYIEKGKVIWKSQEKILKKIVDSNAYLVDFEGHQPLIINAPAFFASEAGHMLYERKPPLALVWSQKGDRIKVSLRSDGTVDVGQIALKYIGGGHKAAAAFSLNVNEEKPWKTIG